MTLSGETLVLVAYDVGGTLNCVVYFRLSVANISPFEKCLRSITLSKNRFNFDEFVLPVASPLVSWQFKQMTSAPHCSAKIKKNENDIYTFIIL